MRKVGGGGLAVSEVLATKTGGLVRNACYEEMAGTTGMISIRDVVANVCVPLPYMFA